MPDRHAHDEGRVRCGDVLKHGDEIRADYWSGRPLDDLAAQWCVSLMTIMVLAYRGDGAEAVRDSSGWEPTSD